MARSASRFASATNRPIATRRCQERTSPEVGVDAHVACSPTKTLAFPVGNVLLRLGVAVLLRHAKINDMHHVGRLCPWAPDEEVVRLDIAVDEVTLVDRLYARELVARARISAGASGG